MTRQRLAKQKKRKQITISRVVVAIRSHDCGNVFILQRGLKQRVPPEMRWVDDDA
jgi:hypothetical protein